MQYSVEEIKQYAAEEDVKFIRMAFCDAAGCQKNIAIMPEELDRAFQYGIAIDGSAIPGFGGEVHSDLLLRPDPSTLCVLPWRPEHGRVVRMFCSVTRPGGQVIEADTRSLLKKAVEDAQAAGKVKVIGVSNFLRDDLESLLSDCRVKPMVNQILLHISNTDLDLVDFCKSQNIQVEAYSPIAHGEALKNPAIARMAEKYGVSAAQLCIRYVIQLGAVALPKTADPDHMAANAAVDFTISEENMEALKHMDRIADYGDFNIFPVFSGKPLA